MEVLERSVAAVLSDDVDFKQRTIDIIAVPWDQEAEISWRGEPWREVFQRGAFDGIENHAGRVPVRREHTRGSTVGRVVKLNPHDERGLIASLKVARTPLGDETLQLASEDMLGASVGYYVKRGSDVDMNRRTMLRRVKRAFLDHLAMTDTPAYVGAMPLAVRERPSIEPTAGRLAVDTPELDAFLNDDVLKWASSRAGL
jgi:HK97 family phage prohead protease